MGGCVGRLWGLTGGCGDPAWPSPSPRELGAFREWGLLSRATPLSSIGHALLLALLHWVWFSLGWYLQPPPPPTCGGGGGGEDAWFWCLNGVGKRATCVCGWG